MRYSRLFGDTSRFAVRIQLHDDPSPPRGIAPELLGSWGTWELWVEGRCLTRSEQRGTYRDGIEWYLRALLQWLDENALALLNEEPFPAHVSGDEAVADASTWLSASLDGPPLSPLDGEEDAWFEERYAYWERHALPAVGSGAAWPNVVLRRLGDTIEVSWDNNRVKPDRRDLRFIETEGAALVPSREVASVLRESVSELVRTLDATAAFHGLLTNGASAPRDSWKLLVAPSIRDLLLDHAALAPVRAKLEALVPAREALLEHSILTGWLRAVPVASAEAILDLDRMATTPPTSRINAAARSLRRRTPPARTAPWREGYERALEVRESLGWGDEPVPDLARWMNDAGIEARDAAASVGCECSVGQFDEDRARVSFYRSGHLSAPMKRATALGHYVMDMPENGPHGVVTSPWTHWPTAARAKAFAAMLLMPETAVRTIAKNASDSVSCARTVMAKFSVPAEVATWHLFHLRLITEEERALAWQFIEGAKA